MPPGDLHNLLYPAQLPIYRDHWAFIGDFKIDQDGSCNK